MAWGGLKPDWQHPQPYLLRIASEVPARWIPEAQSASGAVVDFTIDEMVPPTALHVRVDGKWVALQEAFGYALSEAEKLEWQKRWLNPDLGRDW